MSEQDWITGNRAAYLRLLRECLGELGADSPEANAARWVLEREEAIVILRQLCKAYGDNDWKENTYLPDIIDKHLGRHLAAAEPKEPR